MSDKRSKQTLITRDEDQEWAKVLHGEMPADIDNDAHEDALVVRNYLIARDEVVALSEVAVTEDLNVLSADEARVVYQQASQKIHNRAASRSDRVRRFFAPAAIGALSLAVILLALPETIKSTLKNTFNDGLHSISADLHGLDYSRYSPVEGATEYPNMLLIRNGTFTMGCTTGWDDTVGCRANEYPPHEVTVEAFELAQHEVTVSQFKKFTDATGYLTYAEQESRGCVHRDSEAEGQPFVMAPEINWRNPGFPQEGQHPVTCISWSDTQAYIAWLNEELGKQYRLPTEAEWEYAARGGRAYAYFWGAEAHPSFANYNSGNDGTDFTTFVGKYPANKFSIHDMSGNLWEWVQDCWHKKYYGAPSTGEEWVDNCSDSGKYTRRGGAWDAPAQGIRSAIRSSGAMNDRSVYYGFRIAQDYIKD
jgi:formylglycine-generating enzyme required for sulfatase activity